MLHFDEAEIGPEGFRLRADLQVPAGRCVSLIGPSGAGKSTLLLGLAGFVPVHAGRIAWQGREITDVPPAQRPVAMLFQDNNLFPHLTARHNVGLALSQKRRLTQAQAESVERVLGEVGLGDLGDRRPAQLSGGQQSRVALARALMQDRPILALDEPFAALGPALRADMLTLVLRLAEERGLTVLMVTHDPGDARRIADLTCVVADGRVSPPQPTEALFADPGDTLRAYLGGA